MLMTVYTAILTGLDTGSPPLPQGLKVIVLLLIYKHTNASLHSDLSGSKIYVIMINHH